MLHLLPRTEERIHPLIIFPEKLFFAGLPPKCIHTGHSNGEKPKEHIVSFQMVSVPCTATVLGIIIPRKSQHKGNWSTICWTACTKHKVLWPWTKSVLIPENASQSQRACGTSLLPKIFPQSFCTTMHSKGFFSSSFGLQTYPCCFSTVFSRILANDQQVRVRRRTVFSR